MLSSIFKSQSLVLAFTTFVILATCYQSNAADDMPNILWLSTEDIGPHLGCYGDKVAKTPNLDALAKKGMAYDVAWSNYPVCAPARTTIITGIYAAAHASGHMRCSVPLDQNLKMFPQYLREAGYYCTNKSKEDYNLQKPDKVWDQSNGKAHYRKRAKGQSFFSVFNLTKTHESQIRKRPHDLKTDPKSIELAPYYPDTPEVREDWGQYYDNIAWMDNWVGDQLEQLEKAKQSDNTIIIFFGDHGSGMPRHKRYAGSSGMRIPLIVYFPEKLKHLAPKEYEPGKHSKRPVGFVDLAPTMLSLANIEPPKEMQGHAFAGKHQTESPKYVYGFRSRMDERVDCSRSIGDGRYVYIRNFMPHLPHGQFIGYQQQTPTTKIWNRMYDNGKLNEVQSYFWGPKHHEEFYDLQADPHETKNLAISPPNENVAAELEKFRSALKDALVNEVIDLEMIPEPQTGFATRENSMFAKRENSNIKAVVEAAMMASDRTIPTLKIMENMTNGNSKIDAVRHWLSVGMLIRGETAFKSGNTQLLKMLDDKVVTVRINAAEVLAKFGSESDKEKALNVLIEAADMTKSDFFSAVWALNAISRLGDKAKSILPKIKDLPRKAQNMKRGGDYVARLIEQFE